jgi:uncharacterized protein (DUF433 family)
VLVPWNEIVVCLVSAVFDSHGSYQPATASAEVSGCATIEDVLGKLPAAEKAQVLEWLIQEPGGALPGIESRPHFCGGEACIVRTRIPVWLLEDARRSGVTEQFLLAAYPTRRAEDLVRVNARNYARSHATEIDLQIRDNETA